MDAIDLKDGMTITDTGAARVCLAIWFADRVGKEGKSWPGKQQKQGLKL